MRYRRILLLGGSGFVGRHVANRLVARGCKIWVPTRRRDRAKHLILLPTCEVIQTDIHDDATLDKLVKGQDAVINLVGILHGVQADFDRAHVALTRRTIAACAKHNVLRYLHLSALGADISGPSMYLRSKGEAEKAIKLSRLRWTIFQPSVIFGEHDRFLNLFAQLARWLPVLPVAGAQTKFQPVWVEDVAEAVVNALDNDAAYGKSYELAGPKVYRLRELAKFAARTAGHPRPVISLPHGLARLQAALMEMMPGEPLLSRDNLDSMKRDSVAAVKGGKRFAPAPELGIGSTPMEPEAALYLTGHSPRTRFALLRARAGR